MDFRSRTWALGVSAILVLASCSTTSNAKAVLAHPELEATDICLFTCEFCFRDEGLVGCANECLMTEGAMNALWRKACPLLGLEPIFQQVPPPSQSHHHQESQESLQQLLQPLQQFQSHRQHQVAGGRSLLN